MNQISILFEKIVELHKENICITDESRNYSYLEIYNKVLLLSNYLISINLDLNYPIALEFEKSINYIVSIFAVWRIGGFFLPLDLNIPEERKKEIIDHSDYSILLNDKIIKDILIDAHKSIKFKSNSSNISNPLDIAYLIYTSGSTADPNGVLVSHSGILNVVNEQIELFEITSKSKMLSYLSISFDASLSEILTTIFKGARLCIINNIQLKSSTQLLYLIDSLEITHICLPLGILSLLNPDKKPKSLKTIITGGELIPISLIKLWSKYLRLVIAYGPTEATICTHIHIASENQELEGILGNPLKKVVQLLEPLGDLSENYELLLGGDCVCIGYNKNPFLNNERFLEKDGIRFFKTGDIVKLVNENLIYLNRKDSQFKVRGYRISPREILKKIDNLNITNNNKIEIIKIDDFIKIVWIFTNHRKISNFVLKEKISSILPSYMLPNYYVEWGSNLLNLNGKLDLHILKNNLKRREYLPLREYEKLETKIEVEIALIWSSFFRGIEIGRNDNFLNLGGDSLQFLSMVLILEKQFPKAIGKTIFLKDTIKDISEKIKLDINHSIIDFELNTDLKIPKISYKTNDSELTSWVITGGFGYLGSYFLKKFFKTKSNEFIFNDNKLTKYTKNNLSKNYPERIACVVRDEHKLNKIIDQRLDILSFDDLLNSNLKPLKILHFASNLNIFLDTQDLNEDNLFFLKKLVEFQSKFKNVSFHYISTLGIAVQSDFEGYFSENKFPDGLKLDNGYAHSKLIAEKFLEKIKVEYQTNIFIHRFSLIGPEKDHISEKDLFGIFLKGLSEIEIIPILYDELKINFLPIDISTQLLLDNILFEDKKYYHYATDYHLTWKELREELNEKLNYKLVDNSYYIKSINLEIGIGLINKKESFYREFIIQYFNSLIMNEGIVDKNKIFFKKNLSFETNLESSIDKQKLLDRFILILQNFKTK